MHNVSWLVTVLNITEAGKCLQQAHGDDHRLVFLRLLPGLAPVSDLEELQQGLCRGPFPGHVCLCHHCQHLLWPGHHSAGLLLAGGLVQRSLAAWKPWHCVFRPCHLCSGGEASSAAGCCCVHHLGTFGLGIMLLLCQAGLCSKSAARQPASISTARGSQQVLSCSVVLLGTIDLLWCTKEQRPAL